LEFSPRKDQNIEKGYLAGRYGGVAEKPSESGNNTHFQRHSCPGPDFWAESGKKGLFSRIFLLGMAFLSSSAILNFQQSC